MGRKRLLDQTHVLSAIHAWIAEQGFPPTVEELRRILRVGSTRTVLRYLRTLEETGSIRRWAGARGIQPLKTLGRGVDTVAVPIVGEAPAGPRSLAEENREGWVRLPRDFVPASTKRSFLLRVRGDSMNQAAVAGGRIENGDLVLVRQQATAETGDIVVAFIDGETTIKRLARAPGYFLLKPESSNRKHQPILLEQDFQVQGVVCRVIKQGADIVKLIQQDTNYGL